MGMMRDAEEDAYKQLHKAVTDCLVLECHKRCPSGDGWQPKCKFCDVQHILDVCSSKFHVAADSMGLYPALCWLINNEHPYLGLATLKG